MKYKILGKTGLKVSICGFGGYRIGKSNPVHYQALKFALQSGINLIDTSANYSDGESEELIGDVITDLAGNTVNRDNLVIVTKAGYIQGAALEYVKRKEELKEPYSEVEKISPDLRHSINPEFLRDEITNSLDRLNISQIDVFLLHNPEYSLSSAESADIGNLRAEFYKRIKKAFEYLEDEVEEGRIKYYGVSSNTFSSPSESRNFISLEKLSEIAESVSRENHFAVIELPLNIIEKGALRIKNQNGNSISVLELAHKNNLGVLANRTLNAIQKETALRLADFKIKEERNEKDLLELLNTISGFEDRFKKEYLSGFNESEKKELRNYFSLSDFLKENYNKFNNIVHFRDAKVNYFIPKINLALDSIFRKNTQAANITRDLNEFSVYVNVMWDTIDSIYARAANASNKNIHNILNNYLEGESINAPLSQKSILMVNSLREVSSSLVGMRTPEYVADVLSSIELDYVIDTYKFWNS